jgi:DNA primase
MSPGVEGVVVSHRASPGLELVMDRNDDIIEEIKRRVDIVALVSRYVTLERAGRRMRSRCPFHEETQASFYVDAERGFYHCFGCGAGGDVFRFLMEIEGLSFPEAGQRLADMAGLEWTTSPDAKQARDRRDIIRKANEEAAGFFQRALRGAQANAAREYLAQRGIGADAIAKFAIGYAPESWDALLKFLAGKGFSGEQAAECGLVKPRDSGGYYDVFRHRIIFPICEVSGRVIGFGGRALDPEDQAKYINSPETALFKKSRTVYGLDLARQAISDAKQVLVVEGYTDVIAVAEAGIENVVACLGTATTPDHLKLLGRYADEIVFIYDGDSAGMQAALRHVEVFEGASADVKVAVLPTGRDPDDVIRTLGADGLLQIIEKRLSLVEYQLRMIFAGHEDDGGANRAAAAHEAAQVLAKVPQLARRSALLATAADWWGRGNPGRTEAMMRVLNEEVGNVLPSRGGHRARAPGNRDRRFITETVSRLADGVASGCLRAEGTMLSAAFSDCDFAIALTERLDPEDLVDERDRAIYTWLAQHLDSGGDYQPHAIIDEFADAEEIANRARELAMRETDCADEWKVFEDNVAKLKRQRAVGVLQEQRAALLAALERGELSAESPEYQGFMRQINELAGDSPDACLDYQSESSDSDNDSDTAPKDVAGMPETTRDEGS